MSIQLLFFPFLFSSYYYSVDPCVACIFSGLCNQSFFPQYWRDLFLFLFFTLEVCHYHLLDVRPYASSGIFLFSGRFVEVLPSSTLRMVPGILRGGQFRCLFLWRDFCYIVWCWVVFSFCWGKLKFFFSSALVWWCPLSIFVSTCKFPFLRLFWSFLH